jgi:hypothetical protein
MRTAKARPIIKVHAHYDGEKPFTEAYADVFAMLLQEQSKEKSSIRTFDGGKPFQYDFRKNQKECDCNGS